MTKKTSDADGDERKADGDSAEHTQSVNERSLLILRLIARLHKSYPEHSDVAGVAEQLRVEDDRAWQWICGLGLIQGDPQHACLTETGKMVVDKACLNATFREILDGSDRLCEPADKHASGVLALLHANFEVTGSNNT